MSLFSRKPKVVEAKKVEVEDLKITIERKYLDVMSEWCVGIQCYDKGYEVWTGGYFSKDLKKAEEAAMAAFRKSIAFRRECKMPTEKEDVVVQA